MDGSTDAANVKEERFIVLYFDPYNSDVSVHLRNVFLCVRQPSSVNAEGLYECFGRALSYMGIDVPHKLVEFGYDGTKVNMGERALKGLLQANKPWLVCVVKVGLISDFCGYQELYFAGIYIQLYVIL